MRIKKLNQGVKTTQVIYSKCSLEVGGKTCLIL